MYNQALGVCRGLAFWVMGWLLSGYGVVCQVGDGEVVLLDGAELGEIVAVFAYVESPEKVDYQLFSPFIANEAKQKYKKQAIIFFKGQIISEFYQRLNTHLPQNV